MDSVPLDVLITRIVQDNMSAFKVDAAIHAQLEKLADPTAGVRLKIRLNTAPVHLDSLEFPLLSKDVSGFPIPVQELLVLRDTDVKRDFACLDAALMEIVPKENNVLGACV
jgi:hypothetical protein